MPLPSFLGVIILTSNGKQRLESSGAYLDVMTIVCNDLSNFCEQPWAVGALDGEIQDLRALQPSAIQPSASTLRFYTFHRNPLSARTKGNAPSKIVMSRSAPVTLLPAGWEHWLPASLKLPRR